MTKFSVEKHPSLETDNYITGKIEDVKMALYLSTGSLRHIGSLKVKLHAF
jgi:hypothetical protein